MAPNGVDRGQSEVVGLALMLALVIIGTTVVLAFSATALNDTRSQSGMQRAEHGMTLFDSSAATVAIGDSEVRTVDFGGGPAGSYRVEPSEGRITITHGNFDGGSNPDGNFVDDGAGDDDHVLYTATLGTVVYESPSDDSVVAYQGGGVWRTNGEGDAVMVSPPEFHYRSATLTLPVVRVDGSGSGSGATSARITRVSSGTSVFPDASQTYPSPMSGTSYLNPTENGRVTVTVESRYAEAWGRYFEQRTDGDVTYPAPDVVRVELFSTGVTGNFPMPNDGGSIEVRGLHGSHSLNNFDITLRPDDADSANFANLQWSMYVNDGNKQFEVHLDQGTGSGCSATVDVTVYYSEDNGNTYESWERDDAFAASCADLNGDGDDEVKMDVDFTSTSVELVNQDYSGNLVHYNPSGATRDDTPTFDQHTGASLDNAGSEDYTYADGEQETINSIMNHYMGALGPGYDLTVDDKNSDSVSEDHSYGNIQYPGGGKFVTYLHVTENEIRVEFA